MSDTSTAPTARKRPRKTRTRRVSDRAPLAVSTLPVNELELRPGTISLICPDCRTWCPVTGYQGRTPKLVPHDDAPTGTPRRRRCDDGSNRRVLFDVPIAKWGEQFFEASRDAAQRRGTRVTREAPPRPPAPPVHRVAPPVSSYVQTARRVYVDHRSRCAACEGRAACPVGQRLAAAAAQERHREPIRQLARALGEEQQRRRERRQRKGRAAEWAKVLPAVRAADDQRVNDAAAAAQHLIFR